MRSVFSVKREGAIARTEEAPDYKPKLDERAGELLEVDLNTRPAATLPEKREFLERVERVRVSDSTISRMLRRLG